VPLEEGDFHALSNGLSRDPQYDDRRLLARRKLGAIGKEAVSRIGEIELISRTSLHRPHAFNGMRVRRLWVYVTRGKKWKAQLKRVLGAELARDLDAAYRNAYLCVALEGDAIETSLRIHVDAWYDGQNLSKRLEREGTERWLGLLNELDGYRLRLADWKGEWRCGELDRDRIEDFLGFWKPGEHALSIEKRWPAPPGARAHAFAPEVPETLVAELVRLVPLYRFTAWSKESDFLFGG
jgi:hypothetical protein